MPSPAVAVTAALLSVPAVAAANEVIALQHPVVYVADAFVPAAARRQCGIEQMIESRALSGLGQRFGAGVHLVDAGEPAAGERRVRLSIVSVDGIGGGGWTGSKAISVRADLRGADGTLVSTVLSRASRGGLLGPVSGTCAIFERVADTLGRDLASWVERQPSAQPAQPAHAGPASPTASSASTEPG